MIPVKLYVTNLPSQMNEAGLRQMFSGAGPLAVVQASSNQSGICDGSDVVEMLRPTDASLAIECLDGSSVKVNEVTVAYLAGAQA